VPDDRYGASVLSRKRNRRAVPEVAAEAGRLPSSPRCPARSASPATPPAPRGTACCRWGIPDAELVERVREHDLPGRVADFHDGILHNLPPRRQVAVDVGCGTGVLAGKKAPHFARVTGIDADEGMAAAASAHLAGCPQVNIRWCGFAEFASAADDGGADLITTAAVLHHLDLADTLARIPGRLAPGGRRLVGRPGPRGLAGRSGR
jgi:SAM-dependent methyltransferase